MALATVKAVTAPGAPVIWLTCSSGRNGVGSARMLVVACPYDTMPT